MVSEENNSDLLENQADENNNMDEIPEDKQTVNTENNVNQSTVVEDQSESTDDKPELTDEEKLILEIDEKNREIESLKDKILRVQAQASNDKKRFKADAERLSFESKKRFLKKMLDIRDNIDRALSAFDLNDEQQKSHAEGITMIGGQFDDMFSMEGIQEMKAKGEMYDLLKHEIASRVPYNGPENRVIDVVQKGYVMDNKVLRVAKVVLSMKITKEKKQQEINLKSEEKANKE